MFIENVSYSSILKGTHGYPGTNTMLIQNVDAELDFPEPKYEFRITRQYTFADVENDDESKLYGAGITDEQAEDLVNDLIYAKENELNIIVHCVAGICRSGAVVDVGVMMGFDEPEQRLAFLIEHGIVYDSRTETVMVLKGVPSYDISKALY